MKQVKEIVCCDVCGQETKSHWWETVTSWKGVKAEFYAPIDLCDECMPHFDKVSNKWKQERYESDGLSPEQFSECVYNVKQIIKSAKE